MWDTADAADLFWAERLCCVFTWVKRDAQSDFPFMVSYDGGVQNYEDALSFKHAAELAYSAICGMAMGSQDCASETDRCPVTNGTSQTWRAYEAIGMLCRPKNGDGYAISTKVKTASECRAKCDADRSRCGAFEYEYVSGDDRECELHEQVLVSRSETEATGPCLVATSGAGDVLLDEPIFGKYRCCWIWKGLGSSPSTTTSAISTSSKSSINIGSSRSSTNSTISTSTTSPTDGSSTSAAFAHQDLLSPSSCAAPFFFMLMALYWAH